MSNTIKLKRGSGSDPGASDLAVGEVALRTDTAKLFTKKDDNSVAEIGGGISDGDKGDITVSSSGATFTIDNDAVTTAKINANAVGLSELFQHNNEGFIATANGSDCVVNTYPTYTESGNVFVVHDIKLNRDSNNNDPVIGAGASPASVTFRTNQDGASGAGIASILNGGGLQMGRMTEYVKLAAPTDQTGQSSYTFTFPITGGSANELLLTNGSGTTSFSLLSNASVASDAAIARTKLANVDLVDDTTPQLGGDLDVQSSKITTATSNGNVKIEPNGTGVVEIRGAGGNDGALQLNCSAQSHGIKLVSPAHSASQSYTLIFPDNQIAADKYLKVKSISGSGSTAIGQLEFEALDANDLGEGTIPDARFPSTLPALNGSALTNLNASNIASGTISASRVPEITLSKIEDFAEGRIMGRASGSGTGDASQLTASSIRTILNVEDGATADQTNAEIAAALSDQRPSMKGATFTDDGTASPVVNIKTDDNSPWAFRLGNDTYSTDVGHGLLAYQENNGNLYTKLTGNGAYENWYFDQSNASTTRTLIHLDTSGAVNLNYAGSTKGYTTSAGFNVNGNFDATGTVDSNELTINGTTVLNSSRSLYNLGVLELGDNIEARFGASTDLKIYHDGSSAAYISNTTGNLYIEGNTSQTAIQIVPDGAVDLRHSGNKKIETTSSGVTVTGTCTATTFSGSGASLTSIPAGNLTGTLPAISGANLTNLPGGGKVLQVVNSRLSGAFSTSSSSYTATGHYVTLSGISSASSKILIMASGSTINTGANGGRIALYKQEGSGSYSNVASDYIATFWGEGDSNNVEGTSSFQFYDTAGSNYASGITYQVYIRNWGGGTAYWSYRGNTASLTAIEISA